MDRQKNVLIINIHGGFPSCMIHKVLNQLKAFNDIYKRSETYTRAYPSNCSASPSLHDLIMDAPLASMIDSVGYEWSHVRRASRSIFHVFKQNGYTTNIFGPFGLDKKLDPHVNMHDFPGESTKSLMYFGVDEFESQDAAFTCQMGFAHDRDVLSRVCRFYESRDVSRPSFNMVNLFGCQDIHKCNFNNNSDNSKEDKVSLPSISVEKIDEWSANGILANVEFLEACEKRHAETICSDNPRNDQSNSAKVEALKRSAMLYDWLRGISNNSLSVDDTLRISNEMNRFAWKCLIELDKSLSMLFKTLHSNKYLSNTIIYITSDNPISLFEHGEISEAPWDSCLKTFLLIYNPEHNKFMTSDEPYTLAHLPLKILKDSGIHADWHINVTEGATITVGLSPSWLCRTFLNPKLSMIDFRGFFMRYIIKKQGRLYTIIQWFSIFDLLKCNDIEFEHLSYNDTLKICTRIHEWKNPVYYNEFEEEHLQVFDISVDPEEKHNIVQGNWIKSDTAVVLKRNLNNTIEECGYHKLSIRFPQNMMDLTPDKITFSSIQMHNRMKDRMQENRTATLASVSCQTELPVLNDVLLDMTNGDFAKYLMSKINKILHVPLTIFINKNENTWQDWLPDPVIGTFNYDTFTYLARSNLSITSIKGTQYKISNNGKILIHKCIVSQNSTMVQHKSGQVMLFNVDRLDDISIDNQPKKHLKLSNLKKNSNGILPLSVDQEKDVPSNKHIDSTFAPHERQEVPYTKVDSPKSEVSTGSDKSRKVKSRTEIANGVRRVDSFNSKPKIQPNVLSKGSVKDMELGRKQKENHR